MPYTLTGPATYFVDGTILVGFDVVHPDGSKTPPPLPFPMTAGHLVAGDVLNDDGTVTLADGSGILHTNGSKTPAPATGGSPPPAPAGGSSGPAVATGGSPSGGSSSGGSSSGGTGTAVPAPTPTVTAPPPVVPAPTPRGPNVTTGEKISHLVGEYTYSFLDTAPVANSVLKVTSVDTVNRIVKVGNAAVSLPDPLIGLDYDAVSKVITAKLKSGSSFDANIGAVDTDVTLKSVKDVGIGTNNIVYQLTDGSTVTYTPTINSPALKADKTTEIKSTHAALTITDPTLADDVTLGLTTNVNSGLLQLSATGKILPKFYDTDVLRLPSTPYNPASGANPAGKEGDLLRVGAAGVMDIVPFGGTTSVSNYKVITGDILKYYSGQWHIIMRSQVISLAASKVQLSAFTSTTSFSGSLQKVMKDVADLRVPVSRKLISFDATKLTMNGHVNAPLSSDITMAFTVNRPNGIGALNSLGVFDLSLMPASAFEYHGGVDMTKAIPSKRPDGTTDWNSGDTLEILVGADPSITAVSRDAGAATPQKVMKGEIVIWDGRKWVVSAAGGSLASGKVLTGAGTTGLTNLQVPDVNPPHALIAPVTLNEVFSGLNTNAAFLPADNQFAGDNEFQGDTTIRKLIIGATGTESTFPTVRATADGQALVSKTDGTVTWGKVAGAEVSASVTGISGSDVDTLLSNVYDASIHRSPPTGSQRLSGETLINTAGKAVGGAHTVLDTNAGVILGDHTTENQLGGMIFNAGTVNASTDLDSIARVKLSTTTAEVPAANSLLEGEFAVNIPDKRLFVGSAGGIVTELDFVELPVLTTAGEVLRIDTAGTGTEWAELDKAAIADGDEIDVTADPSTTSLTIDTLYTVKAKAVAHANFGALAGEELPMGAKILATTNGKFIRIDEEEVTAKVEISNTFPSTHPPKVGYLWFKEDEQRLFIRIDNGGNPVWVDAAPARIALGSFSGTGNRMVYADSSGSLKVDTTGMTTTQKLDLIGVSPTDLKTLLDGLP